ncbi:hypothetical protein WA158_000388 [Blastocystis sp. Blastoise]
MSALECVFFIKNDIDKNSLSKYVYPEKEYPFSMKNVYSYIFPDNDVETNDCTVFFLRNQYDRNSKMLYTKLNNASIYTYTDDHWVPLQDNLINYRISIQYDKDNYYLAIHHEYKQGGEPRLGRVARLFLGDTLDYNLIATDFISIYSAEGEVLGLSLENSGAVFIQQLHTLEKEVQTKQKSQNEVTIGVNGDYTPTNPIYTEPEGIIYHGFALTLNYHEKEKTYKSALGVITRYHQIIPALYSYLTKYIDNHKGTELLKEVYECINTIQPTSLPPSLYIYNNNDIDFYTSEVNRYAIINTSNPQLEPIVTSSLSLSLYKDTDLYIYNDNNYNAIIQLLYLCKYNFLSLLDAVLQSRRIVFFSSSMTMKQMNIYIFALLSCVSPYISPSSPFSYLYVYPSTSISQIYKHTKYNEKGVCNPNIYAYKNLWHICINLDSYITTFNYSLEILYNSIRCGMKGSELTLNIRDYIHALLQCACEPKSFTSSTSNTYVNFNMDLLSKSRAVVLRTSPFFNHLMDIYNYYHHLRLCKQNNINTKKIGIPANLVTDVYEPEEQKECFEIQKCIYQLSYQKLTDENELLSVFRSLSCLLHSRQNIHIALAALPHSFGGLLIIANGLFSYTEEIVKITVNILASIENGPETVFYLQRLNPMLINQYNKIKKRYIQTK